jgi:hypothetical protein
MNNRHSKFSAETFCYQGTVARFRLSFHTKKSNGFVVESKSLDEFVNLEGGKGLSLIGNDERITEATHVKSSRMARLIRLPLKIAG